MRFSVIIPLYNKAPYVKKAIESVLAQTLRDFELVVIDDGSSDDSFAVADAALKECAVPYQLVHQENAGVSTARNNGVSLSHGDYICFLDADDWWAPTFLEKMDGLIRDYPEAGIYGVNYYIVKKDKCRVAVQFAHTGYINYFQSYRKMQMPLWTGAVCIPKSVFEETGGFKPQIKLGEDFEVWIRIAMRYKVSFLNDALSFYFQDSDPTWRLVGKLHPPENHMLWNLRFLEKEEITNSDYKRLIDEIRTYSLMPYYLSDQYRKEASAELNKVNWSLQPLKIRIMYQMPVYFLKWYFCLRNNGSKIKQLLINHL